MTAALLFALALAAADEAAAPPRARVLVLDLMPNGVPPETARIATGIVAGRLGERSEYDVVTAADVRAVTEVEATKQQLGCDDASCLAEIAGALGARYVVHGDVGKLGDVLVVNLSLFDGEKNQAAGRKTLQVDSPAALAARLPATVDALVGASPAEPTRSGPQPALLWSGVAVGAIGLVAGIGSAAGALAMSSVVGTPSAPPDEKLGALFAGRLLLVGAGASAVAATVGAGLLGASFVVE